MRWSESKHSFYALRLFPPFIYGEYQIYSFLNDTMIEYCRDWQVLFSFDIGASLNFANHAFLIHHVIKSSSTDLIAFAILHELRYLYRHVDL